MMVGLTACIRVGVETMYLSLPGIGRQGAGHLRILRDVEIVPS